MTKISFVLPMYNEEDSILKCINSIFSQDCRGVEIEIVVVDNGSTDRGPYIAENLGAKVEVKKNGTIASLRNHGAKSTNGDYFAFVDSDCVLPSNWLGEALSTVALENVGACGATYSKAEVENWIEGAWYYEYKHFIGKTKFIPSGNFFIKKSVFISINGFDDELTTCEDADICERIVSIGYDVYYNYKMQSYHLDSPKTLGQFFKKEYWYGRHQLKSYIFPKLDKVLFASIVYMFLLVILAISIILNLRMFFLTFSILNLHVFVYSFYRMSRSKKYSKIFELYALTHIYFFGRGLGIFFSMFRIGLPPICRRRH